MSRARKCDRCGLLYHSYNLINDPKNINAIVCVNLGDDDKYWGRPARDLCPECSEEFAKWFRERGMDLDGNPYQEKVENTKEEPKAVEEVEAEIVRD